MPGIYTVENGRVSLSFHYGQGLAWDSEARIIGVISGAQSGKTTFGPWWLYREIYGDGPDGRFAGRGAGDYLAVTASYDLFKLKMLPETLNVFENLLRVGRYWSGAGVIELSEPKTGKYWAERSSDPMWGRVILRSASAPGGLESATAQAAWLDEAGQDAFTISTWEAVQRRLGISEGRALITTTPYNLGWLKTEVYDRWVAGDQTFDVIQFESVLNPSFPRREFERARRTMPSWKFDMFYRGLFARPAGLIYGDFDWERHSCEPFPIPRSWMRLIGVDFGAVNTAIVWIAIDPDSGVHYVYRESLGGDKTSGEHAAGVKQLLEQERLDSEPKRDSQGREVEFGRALVFGGAPSEQQARWDWQAAGVAVRRPVVSDVEAGIDRVIALIKTDKFVVFKGLKQMRESLATYGRVIDEATGKPTDKIKDKEQFHLLDATRYAIGGLRKIGMMVL